MTVTAYDALSSIENDQETIEKHRKPFFFDIVSIVMGASFGELRVFFADTPSTPGREGESTQG